MTTQAVFELVGRWFVVFAKKSHYSKLLEVGGDTLCEYLLHLNAFHAISRRWYFPKV